MKTREEIMGMIASEALGACAPGQLAAPASGSWMPMETAPRDGSEFIAYCPPAHGMRHMACICSWHESAGFCVDELREPSHWTPVPGILPNIQSPLEGEKGNQIMSMQINPEPCVKTLMLPPRVGMTSLVGIGDKDYPIKFGNYCSIAGGPYLCNMWAENLKEWALRNQDGGLIEVTEYRHAGRSVGLVTDGRLKAWCNHKPCVTGHGWPSVAVMRRVCAHMGVSVDDRFCGCEKAHESPHISESWSVGSHAYLCSRCKRKWSAQSPPEGGKEA